MSLIEVLLSSAVIVAVIQYFQGEKNNKLQYITEERAKWRKEIKEIITEIGIADFQTIEKCLTDLGKNLNAYGYCPEGRYENDKLDFLKDEHIWREMDIIQKAVNEHNMPNFEKSKKNLIHYLFLLLKFDWERSKQEIKGEKAIPISIVSFGMGVIVCVFSRFPLKSIQENLINIFIFIIAFSLLYILLWVIYGIERMQILRVKEWYSKMDKVTLSFILVGIELGAMLILAWKWENFEMVFLFVAIAVLLVPCLIISNQDMYRKYDENVRKILEREN